MMDLGNLPGDGEDKTRSEEGEVKVGHCSLTSFAIEEPVKGGLYAGLLSDLEKQMSALASSRIMDQEE